MEEHAPNSPIGARPEDPIERERVLSQVKSSLFREESAPLALGRYTVLDPVGSGGGGVVYLAYDPDLNRRVALKLVHPTSDDPEDRERLLREAQAMARLSHPNVAAIHDVGTFGEDQLPRGVRSPGTPGVFLVMEFVEGSDLGQWLAEEDRTWREKMPVLLQAGRGLAAAHAQDIAHRDFKPSNVRVGADGRARVLDFGLARATGAEVDLFEEEEDPALAAPTAARLGPIRPLETPITQVNGLLGTPAYMAPEQHTTSRSDARSDQYSYCAVLFEALYGERAFPQRELRDLADAKNKRALPTVGNTKVPPWIQSAILRGLEPDPARRFASMEDLLRALQRDPVRRVRRALAVALPVMLAAGFLGVSRYQRATQEQVCQDHSADIDPVWGDGVKAEVKDTLLRQQTPLAREVWNGVSRDLDTYIQRWTELRTKTCLGATLDHSVSVDDAARINHCLDQRLRSAEGLVRGLRRMDEDHIRGAVRAVGSLPTVQSCGRPARQVERPSLPFSAQAGLEVSAKLAESRSLGSVGDYERAGQLAHEAVLIAKESGDFALVADALRHEALDQAWLGHVDNATQLLHQSRVAGERAGDPESALRSMVVSIYHVGVRLNDAVAAEQLVDLTRARLAAEGALIPRGVAVDFEINVCWLREHQGEIDRAIHHCARAREMAQEIFGPDSLAVVDILNTLGVLAERNGDFVGAYEIFTELATRSAELQGANHPNTLIARANSGVEARWVGKTKQGLEEVSAALNGLTELMGPTNWWPLWFHHARGYLLTDLRREREALVDHDYSYQARVAELGGAHRDTALSTMAIAETLGSLGHYAEAERLTRDAIEAFADNTEHPAYLAARMLLGRLLRAQGELDEAVRIHEAVFEEAEETMADRGVMTAWHAGALADSYIEIGRRVDAVPLLEDAIRKMEAGTIDGLYVGQFHFSLARALVEQDPERALDLAGRALVEFEAHDYMERDAVEVRAWIDNHAGARPSLPSG